MIKKVKAILFPLVIIGTGAYAAVIIDNSFFYGAFALSCFILFNYCLENYQMREDVLRLHRRISEYEKQNKELIARLSKYEGEAADISPVPHYFD